jgi:CheY-like chemotaxis protein
VKDIKELMKSNTINRGFAIATAAYVDLNIKLECLRNGMDYYVSKPLDLNELNAIV